MTWVTADGLRRRDVFVEVGDIERDQWGAARALTFSDHLCEDARFASARFAERLFLAGLECQVEEEVRE